MRTKGGALVTALGGTAREALVALAEGQAAVVAAASTPEERNAATRLFMSIVAQIDKMDRADIREKRVAERNAAAIEWMNRRDEQRQRYAAERAARELNKMLPAATAKSGIIDELRAKRENKTA